MSKASLNFGLLIFGIALMAFSGARLGHIVGVTWEFAAFATGIILSAACGAALQTKKRIDDLEKKVAELEISRKTQA